MFAKQAIDTVECIIQIFETGRLSRKSYGTVTNISGDKGGLTYGKHQASINSGSLYGMIALYCKKPGAQYANAMLPYLQQLLRADAALATNTQFRSLLKSAGDDPIMQEAQDEYFVQRFMQPAIAFCNTRGYTSPLTLAVVYDSIIHGSFKRVGARVPILPEREWAKRYCEARRNWLASHANPVLRACVYRPNTFLTLIANGKWDLPLPLLVRGITIRATNVDVAPAATTPTDFNNTPTQPVLRERSAGEDVVYLQKLLNYNGYPIAIDGDFGKRTEIAVKAFQSSKGLVSDGVVGRLTWDKLDDVLPDHAA